MDKIIEFMDACGYGYGWRFPIKNTETPMRLKMWVVYDIGYYSNVEYKDIPRGYYLYISEQDLCSMGITLNTGNVNVRVLLSKVKRKSEGAYRDCLEKAGKYAVKLAQMYCSNLDVDWENGNRYRRYGSESGIGMWSDTFSLADFDLCSHV